MLLDDKLALFEESCARTSITDLYVSPGEKASIAQARSAHCSEKQVVDCKTIVGADVLRIYGDADGVLDTGRKITGTFVRMCLGCSRSEAIIILAANS